MPRILIFAPAYEPAVKAGGPARSLTNLVRRIEGTCTVDVVARDRDLGDAEPFAGLSGRRVTHSATTVYYLDDSCWTQWRTLVARLSSEEYDLIMVNSFWDRWMSLTPVVLRLANRLRGPILLMPRGELEPGALALKAPKKRMAAPVFRSIHRRGVSLIGTTSLEEAANSRIWFPDTPVITTTNNLPDAIPMGSPASDSTSLRAVFLSRISAKKGVLQLLAGLREATAPLTLSIVGPIDDAKYWTTCQRATSALPSHITVSHTPLATRGEIAPLLWNSDCMVLLTAGENYGHVIAEALQAGCPVITTPTTPWTEVIRRGGGEIVEDRDDPKEVAAVLDRWAAMTPKELAVSRVRARAAFEEFEKESGPNIVELALAALEQKSQSPAGAGQSKPQPT